MTQARRTDSPIAWLDHLVLATNTHDLKAIADCFADDYVNHVPAHPARGFRGRSQVNANWANILAAVPDLRARVISRAITENTVWSEWEMTGTRRDGQPHHMCGVIIFEITDGHASSARFYLEPVGADSVGINATLRRQLGPSR